MARDKRLRCPFCMGNTIVTNTQNIYLVNSEGTLAYKFEDPNAPGTVVVHCTTGCGRDVMGWPEIAEAYGLKVASR